MSTVAREMLENHAAVFETDKAFLQHMQNYRSSLSDKLWLLRYEENQKAGCRALRSYRISLLLNLFVKYIFDCYLS
ncbi:MAG: hypothetical protein U0N82_10935 [Oscillospiraceae bacterium]